MSTAAAAIGVSLAVLHAPQHAELPVAVRVRFGHVQACDVC
jgi:hypothetical protein